MKIERDGIVRCRGIETNHPAGYMAAGGLLACCPDGIKMRFSGNHVEFKNGDGTLTPEVFLDHLVTDNFLVEKLRTVVRQGIIKIDPDFDLTSGNHDGLVTDHLKQSDKKKPYSKSLIVKCVFNRADDPNAMLGRLDKTPSDSWRSELSHALFDGEIHDGEMVANESKKWQFATEGHGNLFPGVAVDQAKQYFHSHKKTNCGNANVRPWVVLSMIGTTLKPCYAKSKKEVSQHDMVKNRVRMPIMSELHWYSTDEYRLLLMSPWVRWDFRKMRENHRYLSTIGVLKVNEARSVPTKNSVRISPLSRVWSSN